MKLDTTKLKDGLFSKKLWFAVGCIKVVLVYALLTIKFPALVPLYETFVGGVVGICALYLTGNVVNKVAVAKGAAAPNKVDNPDA